MVFRDTLMAILAYFCIAHAVLSAYVYHIEPIQKWQPEKNRYHYVIGNCDFHDKNHPQNIPQRARIENHLRSSTPSKTHVVVEDLSTINDAGQLGCGAFTIQSRQGILAGLGTFCKDNKIPMNNPEYRYCRVVALGPVINNISADPFSFSSTKKITVGHIIKEIENAYHDLIMGTTNAKFKQKILQKYAEIEATMQTLRLHAYRDKTIAAYLAAVATPMTRLEIVKQLLTFDGILIGLRFVDAVLKSPDKERIVLFGGGTHILQEAIPLLKEIDQWESISKEPTSVAFTKASTNTTITESSYCSKPAAVSLELLDHYLKE